MPEQFVYRGIPYFSGSQGQKGLDAGPGVGVDTWNPFLTPERRAHMSPIMPLSLSLLDRFADKFKEMKEEELEEDIKKQQDQKKKPTSTDEPYKTPSKTEEWDERPTKIDEWIKKPEKWVEGVSKTKEPDKKPSKTEEWMKKPEESVWTPEVEDKKRPVGKRKRPEGRRMIPVGKRKKPVIPKDETEEWIRKPEEWIKKPKATTEDKKKEEIVEQIRRGELKLVDITNFIKAYNNFMKMAYHIQKLAIEDMNKTFKLNIPVQEYDPIVPKQVLFPYDDRLRQFERKMKKNVDEAFKRLVPLFDPMYLEIVNIRDVFKD